MTDDLRGQLERAGLRGSYLVRDLSTGEELSVEPDLPLPLASLVKVPLGLAVLENIRLGTLDPASRLHVRPGRITVPGPTGITRFQHVADIAVEDALSLAVSLSDNAAADALFGLVTPPDVMAALGRWNIGSITVREGLSPLTRTPAEVLSPEDADLAHALAIEKRTEGGGHRLEQFDVDRTNVGSARGLVDMLDTVWTALSPAGSPSSRGPSLLDPWVAGRMRDLMGANVHRHRLTPDFASDASRWSSKTGTQLNLRHEIGVVEHADGAVVAIAALTESRVTAAAQPGAEAVMAGVARQLHDYVRSLEDPHPAR
ncbi:serine hydrolase [Nesterenkonia sp. HG001]|uniref:serine hydrolase n=1 Tax=Nesterenkonia sp. HG001 TaxID=2983207 RepID=UPI002AC58DAF|nr:serine hydrolase [Nesterenkonia sp. HG001]MDZ5078819.1 class A beta-lactamase-related serine hydrolase [Nesterenkonia sp. HG001]